jgi:hypothetical protein
MGRGPHFYVEDTRHGANLNACIVGDTAAARKGTSLDRARKIVQLSDPEWALANDGEGGLSTAEGLINAVRDDRREGKDVDPGVGDKRLLAAMGEFAETLAKMHRQENPLSATLRAAWDGKTLRNRTKSKPMTATDAHVSVIGHITEADLRELFGRTDIFNGFGNRFLWAMAKRSRVLPFGGSLRVESLKELVQRFTAALAWAEAIEREIDFDAKTRGLWPRYYEQLGESEPGPFGAITDRAEPQVRRLALIYAAMDRSQRIKVAHLKAALEVWRYCEASAAYLFADAPGDSLEARVLRAIADRDGWAPRSKIHRRVKTVKAFQLTSTLNGLRERGVIERREVKTDGRPRAEYRICER